MPRILFFEVEPEVRNLLQKTLEQHGYDVRQQDGPRALRPIGSLDPKTILVLTADAAMTCEPGSGPAHAGARRPRFLIALLRSLTVWGS
jgi:CheY-like chemotaxis protein